MCFFPDRPFYIFSQKDGILDFYCTMRRPLKKSDNFHLFTNKAYFQDTGYPHDGRADKDSYPRTTGKTNTLC